MEVNWLDNYKQSNHPYFLALCIIYKVHESLAGGHGGRERDKFLFNKGEGGWGTVYAGWIYRIVITIYCLFIYWLI